LVSLADFRGRWADVVGASFDPPAENRFFAVARRVGFPLLSDTSREVGARYQVTRDPGDANPGYARRVTYLIDPEGRISAAYAVADIGAHPDQVLADLRAAAG
jgi:peroxiredoxin Q/BCP